jgi:hypothetical protein
VEELRRVVSEGEAAARRIIAIELRKKLGRFYILWGSFPMAASAPLVAALDVGWLKSALETYVFSVPLYVIYLVAVLGVYFGLTFRLFGTFYRVATSRLGVRRGRWPGVISAAYFLGVVAMWFLSGGRFAVFFAAVYAAGVAFFTYGAVYSGFARPRYYDHLALVGFLLLFPASFVWSYAIQLAIGLMWIYAGVKSLEEGYGGGQASA